MLCYCDYIILCYAYVITLHHSLLEYFMVNFTVTLKIYSDLNFRTNIFILEYSLDIHIFNIIAISFIDFCQKGSLYKLCNLGAYKFSC